MANPAAAATCIGCSQTFAHKSSFVRHTKRCLQNLKTKTRQKSCRQCASAKCRCDLQRPHCGRCQTRSLECEFQRDDGTAIPPPPSVKRAAVSYLQGQDQSEASYLAYGESSASPLAPLPDSAVVATSLSARSTTPKNDSRTVFKHWDNVPVDIAPELVSSRQRSQVILGTPHGTPSTDAVARHTMFFVIRVLKSWTLMMAATNASRFPPIIHHLQLTDGLPLSLSYCYVLVKMWYGQEDDKRDSVIDLMNREVERLLGEHHSYAELDLIAATQSLLILAIVLLLGDTQAPALSHPLDAQLLVKIWEVKQHLAGTGLYLDEEVDHAVPPWKKWAIVSAKRRTIMALHHLEWAWSLLHSYPALTCFELGPLPAPAAGYLWHEPDETQWKRKYGKWLLQWEDGIYKMGELFHIKPGSEMGERSEMWLAEVDEFGMMVMAEVNAISHVL